MFTQCLKFRETTKKTTSQINDAAVRATSLLCDNASKRARRQQKKKTKKKPNSNSVCRWKYKHYFELISSKSKGIVVVTLSPPWPRCASADGSHTGSCAPGAGTCTCRAPAGRRSQTLPLHGKRDQHEPPADPSPVHPLLSPPPPHSPRQRYGTTMCMWLRHCLRPFLHQLWMLMGWLASTTLVIWSSGYTCTHTHTVKPMGFSRSAI